jgi:osmotically inducible protein OsmC
LALGSGAYEGPFSLKSRVEDVERATNPEELSTTASVRLEQRDGRFSITTIELRTSGQVSGVSAERFEELAREAKETCPVSRVLAAAEITLEATLAAPAEA